MLTEGERRRVRAWLEAEIGREPDRDIDDSVDARLRALCLHRSAAIEVFIEFDTLLDPDDDEAIPIAAGWVLRFGSIGADEQFAAIVRTVRLAPARRSPEASSPAPSRPFQPTISAREPLRCARRIYARNGEVGTALAFAYPNLIRPSACV